MKKIMKALKETEQQLCKVFENLEPFIKEEITFIHFPGTGGPLSASDAEGAGI